MDSPFKPAQETFVEPQFLAERRRGMTRSEHYVRGTYWGT
jgi:hypothetical protein